MDGWWHRAGIKRITYSKGWLEDTMGDTGFRFFVNQIAGCQQVSLERREELSGGVQYSCAGSLTTSSRGGWDTDQWP